MFWRSGNLNRHLTDEIDRITQLQLNVLYSELPRVLLREEKRLPIILMPIVPKGRYIVVISTVLTAVGAIADIDLPPVDEPLPLHQSG